MGMTSGTLVFSGARVLRFQFASEHLWQMLSEQVPTITLVLINSLLLPPTINKVAGWQKASLKTQEETLGVAF